MSLGGSLSGGSKSSRDTSSSTTPWSGIASQLAGTLKTNLSNLASGSNLSKWISTLTQSTTQATKTGISNIKEAFGASGMSVSSAFAKSIGDFQVQQQIGLNQSISQVEQQNVSNQLSALQEIISLASGTGSQVGHQWGDTFGWGVTGGIAQKG